MPSVIPALRPHRGSPRTTSGTSSRGTGGPSPRGALARASSVGIPVVLAIAYCLYAAFMAGDNGWSTGLTWLIALVSGAVLGLVCFVVGRWQAGRQSESVATVYAVVFGCAMGYLLSLSDWSILKASLVGFALALSMGVSVFYISHTHRANRPDRSA